MTHYSSLLELRARNPRRKPLAPFLSSAQTFWVHPVESSVRNIAMLLTIALYLALRFMFIGLLPEKILIDADKIVDIMAGGEAFGNSFGSTAALFALLPESLQLGLVVALGCLMICLTFRVVRSWGGMMMSWIILLPLLILDLMAPTKETIVVTLSLCVLVASAIRSPRNLFLLASIIILYLAYGALVRSYYLMILAVFLGLTILRHLPAPLRLAAIFTVMAGLLWVPDSIFMQLQGTRDESNDYALYIAFSETRTAFFNPFPPDNLLHFLGNYAYAAIVLNLPFFTSVTARDLILFVNILIYGWLLITAKRYGSPTQRILARLFLAHLPVLWLFEPDLGSYFRHFSSVFAYLIPTLALREMRAIRQKETNA